MGERKTHPDSSTWRSLPSDRTTEEFLAAYHKATGREKKPSQPFFQAALRSIDVFHSDNIILKQIYRKGVQGKKDPVSRSPNLIPWEVEQLITKVLEIRDRPEVYDGDAYPDAVLLALATELDQNLGYDISQDFIATQYLNNDIIRDKLLRRFHEPFSKRLKLLEDYVFSNDSGVDIQMLRTALERIDVLISEFEDKSKTLPSSTQSLFTLFENLTSVREELIPKRGRDSGVDYYVWNPKADPKLSATLKEQIQNTKRKRSEAQREDFLKNYREYLRQLLPDSAKKDAQDFWNDYQNLRAYFFTVYDLAQFEQDVREELYQFARDYFEDIKNVHLFELSYSTYPSKYAAVGFARYRLADIHRDIQGKIHSAARLIVAVNAYRYFLGSSTMSSQTIAHMLRQLTLFETMEMSNMRDVVDESALRDIHAVKSDIDAAFERFQTIVDAMEHQFGKLFQMHSDIPFVGLGDIDVQNAFIEAYQRHAVPVFRDNDPNNSPCGIFDKLAQPTVPGDPRVHFRKLIMISELLTMECKVVAALEIEKAVPELLKEYSQMCQRLRE